MIDNLVHINYHDHHVHVGRDTSTQCIVLFKYNDSRCDFAVFAVNEWDRASDYLLTALPEGEWGFVSDCDREDSQP